MSRLDLIKLFGVSLLLAAMLRWDYPASEVGTVGFTVYARTNLTDPWELLANVGTNQFFMLTNLTGTCFFRVAAYRL